MRKHLVPKFMNNWGRDSLETGDKEKRHKTAKRTAALGAVAGGLSGSITGGLRGAAAGAAVGGALNYGASRLGSKITDKIRKSGGGGEIDDYYLRNKDRIDVAQGKMSKADYKKKWYRSKDK